MLSFGFDTCIKTNSPLVSRLINDTQITLQSEAASDHQGSVFNRFSINMLLHCSTPYTL